MFLLNNSLNTLYLPLLQRLKFSNLGKLFNLIDFTLKFSFMHTVQCPENVIAHIRLFESYLWRENKNQFKLKKR